MQPKFFCLFLFFVLASTQHVTVFPEGTFVSYRGGEAEFSCYSLPLTVGQVIRIQWLVNGSLLERFNFDNAVTEFDSIANGIGTLEFSNLTQNFNMTRIQCIAHYRSRPPSTSTEATILLLQGIPQAVTSLSFSVFDSTLHLTWIAPLSLDVTDVHPDVTYHVDVINSSSLATLESARGVEVTQFNYTIPSGSSCYIIMVIVTSVNAANMTGGRSTVSYIEAGTRPQFVSAVRTSAMGSNFTYLMTMTDPVCDIDLIFADMDVLERVEMDNNDVTIVDANVTFSTQQLKANRRYTVTIGASNIHGSAISVARLSTHGVQDAVIAHTETGEIKVNVSFSELSSEAGAVLVFINKANLSRSVVLTLDRNIADNYTLPFELYPGQHEVFVHDIEQDGTLHNGVGYPAFDTILPTRANSAGFSLQPNIGLSCDIKSGLMRIYVECAYDGDSLIAGFQITAMLSNSSKLYVAKTINRQALAVLVEENGLYLVTVLAIREGTGIANSGVGLTRLLEVTSEALSTVNNMPTTDNVMEEDGGLSPTVLLIVVLVPLLVVVLLLVVVIVTVVVYCVYKERMKKENENSSQSSNPDGIDLEHVSGPDVSGVSESNVTSTEIGYSEFNNSNTVHEETLPSTEELSDEEGDPLLPRVMDNEDGQGEAELDSDHKDPVTMPSTGQELEAQRENLTTPQERANDEAATEAVSSQDSRPEGDKSAPEPSALMIATQSSQPTDSQVEESGQIIPNQSHHSLVSYAQQKSPSHSAGSTMDPPSHQESKATSKQQENDVSAANVVLKASTKAIEEATAAGSDVASPIVTSATLFTNFLKGSQGKGLADEQLNDIADNMPSLDLVLPQLKLSSESVNYIQDTLRDDLKNQKRQALQRWKVEQGEEATIGKIVMIIVTILSNLEGKEIANPEEQPRKTTDEDQEDQTSSDKLNSNLYIQGSFRLDKGQEMRSTYEEEDTQMKKSSAYEEEDSEKKMSSADVEEDPVMKSNVFPQSLPNSTHRRRDPVHSAYSRSDDKPLEQDDDKVADDSKRYGALVSNPAGSDQLGDCHGKGNDGLLVETANAASSLVIGRNNVAVVVKPEESAETAM